jgi:hypothetical protein
MHLICILHLFQPLMINKAGLGAVLPLEICNWEKRFTDEIDNIRRDLGQNDIVFERFLK